MQKHKTVALVICLATVALYLIGGIMTWAVLRQIAWFLGGED